MCRYIAQVHALTLRAYDQLGGVLPEERTCHLDAGYDGQPAHRALLRTGKLRPFSWL